MSLATLEAASIAAEALCRPREKALRQDAFGGMPYLGGQSQYSSDGADEQLAHYRGRFYSAARIAVHRGARQPVFVARRRQRARTNTAMNPRHVPAWAGSPSMLDIVETHPFLDVISDPNPNCTTFNMWEMALASLWATGRGFLVALKGADRTFDLWPVPTTWMKPTASKTQAYAKWEIKPPGHHGDPLVVDDKQVAHFYFADPENPTCAISPLDMVARAVLSDEAIASSQYASFKNGGMPRYALIAGDVMNESSFTDNQDRTSAARPIRLEAHQRRQIITWFMQQFAGVQKHGLPIVLDAIIRDIKELSRKPAEMAFLESAGLTKEQIYEGIGVSKILTGSLEGTNRASGGLAEQFMVDNTLNPVITMISQTMTKKFGPLFAERDTSEYVIWMAEAQPRDEELRLAYAQLGCKYYSLTRNELRRLLPFNLPWLDGYDDIVIPQTLEERKPEDDMVGVGRLPKPSPLAASLNGAHRLNGVNY